MNPKSTRLILIGVFLLAAVAAATFFLRSSPPADTVDAQQTALALLQQDSEREPLFHFYNGFPGFAQVSVSVQGNDPVERARNYLAVYQDLYLQNHADLSLEVLREDGDTVAFYQTYKGLRVYAAEIVVSLEGDTVFATVGSLLTSDVERQALDTAPAITDADAVDLASATLDMLGADVIGSPELVVFDPSFVSEKPGIVHLAWQFTLNGQETMQVLVDAHSGELLFVLPYSLDSIDLDMQDAEDEANASDDNCFWGSDDVDVGDEDDFNWDYSDDADATEGYFDQIFTVYDFYEDNFGRHSYDGDDSQLELFIHATVDNASWSSYCELIQVKSGWIDYEVLVHEMTHGVIQETSGLNYSYQSGALNESYADVMAVIADQMDGDSNWTLGEDRTGLSGFVRDVTIPKHINDYVSGMANNKAGDYGGVHTNSAIPNYAAFLMSTGGGPFTPPGQIFPPNQIPTLYNIDGIGTFKVLQLYYKVMTMLPNSASFTQASGLTIAQAEQWASTNQVGFTNEDVCQVRNTFANVGLESLDFDCDGTPDGTDNDDDDDGVPDAQDNCDTVANPTQTDKNYDQIGDACQPDPDGDRIPVGGFLGDNCGSVYNPDQKDLNFNGIGDACDPAADGDFDDDGVLDKDDNCYLDYNPSQSNVDAALDDLGDACDPDADGDGYSNDDDNCPFTANADQANSDGDGAGDACDDCPDAGDVNAWTTGIPELGIDPKPWQPDSDGDGIPNACDDDLLVSGLYWELAVKEITPLNPVEVRLRGEPGDTLVLPMPGCMPPEAADRAPRLDRNFIFAGLDPNIFAYLVDSEGMGAGKPKMDGELVSLSLTNPMGGAGYFLQLYLGPDYVPGENSFGFSYSCTEPDEVEEEIIATATPTPSYQVLIAVPSQNVNCRQGPSSTLFESVDILFMDMEYVPLARGRDNAWVLFDGPDYDGNCWVFAENLDFFLNEEPIDLVDISEELLPFAAYPDIPTPTPTPTFTPTPNPTFTPTPFRPQCSDGIDNDGDGDIDMADGRCVDANDNSEDA